MMHIYRCIVGDMDALDLIQLGRELTKIGEGALRGAAVSSRPNGPSLVLRDVFGNRDTSIKEIAERTRLPQSYVSESVAKLLQEGLVATAVDPNDRRRTLVRVSARHRRTVARKAAAPIDAALATALEGLDADQRSEVAQALAMLSERLRPVADGPILHQIRERRPHDSKADA
jgi:DNA-binding MarR family transcriptional regulator